MVVQEFSRYFLEENALASYPSDCMGILMERLHQNASTELLVKEFLEMYGLNTTCLS